MAQWVKASAFGSGHDPRVLGSSPASGSLLSREPDMGPDPRTLGSWLELEAVTELTEPPRCSKSSGSVG